MSAWRAALAAAIATAAIALIVIAPMTASSKSTKRLKIVTEHAHGGIQATAKCPRGYVAIAGGSEAQETGGVGFSEKVGARRWEVRGAVAPKRRGQLVDAQVICAKGAGGLRVVDLGG
ncbi:MAG TPA: hypothetical protein VH391_05405 [Solirubrobacterales bacterium]